MAKRKYYSPLLMGPIDPGEDPSWDFGGSVVTDGDITMYDFSALSTDIQTRIYNKCSYFDAEDMDTSEPYMVISLEEFNSWLENNPWFNED